LSFLRSIGSSILLISLTVSIYFNMGGKVLYLINYANQTI
jgi:hypothetical protein